MKILVSAVVSLLITSYAWAQPNIVVIMTDDLDVPSYNTAIDRGWLPNIKALQDSAVVFDNAFVVTPLCCPSRASFLTGQYPHNHGVLTNFGPDGGADALDESSTIAVALQAAGYRTVHIGKYLNRYGTETEKTHVPVGWTDWLALVDPSTYQVYDYTLNRNGVLESYGSAPEDYQTDVLSRLAVQAVTDAEPFFLALNTLAPHLEGLTPGSGVCSISGVMTNTIRPAPRHVGIAANEPLPMPPHFNEADLSDKASWLQAKALFTNDDIDCLTRLYRDKLESLIAVDHMVGAMVAALPPNTIIIFTSGMSRLLLKLVQQALLVEQATQRWPAVQVRG